MRFQLQLALRYLFGRRVRSFLTTLAIVFGTLVIFGTGTILPTMLKSLQTTMLTTAGQVDVTITHQTGEAFSEKMLNKVKAVAGIRAIAGSLSQTVNIPAGYYKHAKITALTLTGIYPRDAQELRNYNVKEGRFLRATDQAAAVISASLADSLGLKLDDKLNLPASDGVVKLKIVGLLPARAAPGNEEVLISLAEAQKILDLPKRVNTIEVNLDTMDKTQRDFIKKNIESVLGDDYSLGALSSGSEIVASIQMGQMAFNLMGFLSLFMGAFIIFNTFRTIVAERRHDIGMLRAIGATRRMIVGLILAEGFLQGVVGTLIGMGLGYLLGATVLKLMTPLMSSFIHLELGAPVISPSLLILTIALGVGMTLLAGLLPAFNASRVTPLEALRPSMAEVVQRTARASLIIGVVLIVLAGFGLISGIMGLTALGGFMLLIGMVLVAPALVKPIASLFGRLIAVAFAREGTGTIAQSNLTRNPSRAAVTASATMIGLAIIVGLGGMIWSVTGGFLEVLKKSLGSDYLIMPPSVGLWKSNLGAKQDLADKLRAIGGVDVVSTMRFAGATADGRGISLLGIDPVAYPKVAGLTFQEGDPSTAYADLESKRTMIANGVLASQIGVKVGDVVDLSTPTGRKTYRIVGIAGDYLNAKLMTAYISQASLREDFRKSEDILFQINLKDNADAVQVEEKLNRILEDYPQFKLTSGKSYFDENRQMFDAMFAFYFVLLGVMAVPSLIALLNTLAIGIIERTREIGMLRAIGTTRRQLRRIVISESLLLAAIGTAFGLFTGLYLGYVLVLGLSVGGFPVAYVFPYQALLAAIATGLIFGVLAALVPARQAASLNIVEALHYE